MADPYWDVVSQYAVDSILSSPANRMKLGLTDTHIGSVCIKDMFGEGNSVGRGGGYCGLGKFVVGGVCGCWRRCT